MKRTLLAMIASGALLMPSAAVAQDPDPEEFTPAGYEFCGWRDFADREWVMDWNDDLVGAYLVAFARDMSCSAARRNTLRTGTRKQPPYAPFRAGYRCKQLRSAHEFSDVRCIKRASEATYRFQTGA